MVETVEASAIITEVLKGASQLSSVYTGCPCSVEHGDATTSRGCSGGVVGREIYFARGKNRCVSGEASKPMVRMAQHWANT